MFGVESSDTYRLCFLNPPRRGFVTVTVRVYSQRMETPGTDGDSAVNVGGRGRVSLPSRYVLGKGMSNGNIAGESEQYGCSDFDHNVMDSVNRWVLEDPLSEEDTNCRPSSCI